jgi:AbrB family looped-hinge helix DNA binding protein
MNATIDIDKAGRLIVPKKVRDALGLHAGTSIEYEVRGEEFVLRSHRQGKGLYKDRGLWVYDSGAPLTSDDINERINEDRDRRMRYINGESLEP